MDTNLQGLMLGSRFRVDYPLSDKLPLSVHGGTDVTNGKPVVLKVLHMEALEDWKRFDMFQREADLLKGLDHPHLPDFLDFFEHNADGKSFNVLAYSFVEGKNLEEMVEDGVNFGPEETAEIIAQGLKLLKYLHGRKPAVIHRDINPRNLILAPGGTLHLIDLGTGKDLSAAEEFRRGGTFVGTYGFMAPEQLLGETDPRADLYALGMTGVFLLTGRNPGDLPWNDSGPDFGQGRSSERIYTVLERLIRKDPNRRPPSAEDAENLMAMRFIEEDREDRAPSDSAGRHPTSRVGGSRNVAIVERGKGTSALVFENDRSKRTESMIARGVLKFWVERPWVVFIVGAAISGGGLAVPLLFLALLPESRRWARKTLSQVSPVSLRVRGGKVSVPNQLRPLPVEEIDEIDPVIKRNGHLFNLELQFITLRDRTYRVYFSDLEEDDLDEVLEYLESQFGSRVRGGSGY